jgi:AcrR family transcriptional regulator
MAAGARDRRTRRRLVEAAGRLFATHGFKHVTVRAICREAQANVAAVNYHFRDKMGLYTEVLREASEVVRQATAAAVRAGEGLPAREKLAEYVRVHCERLFATRVGQARRRRVALQQLIHREMNNPTPALTALIDHALRPRFEYLGSVIGEILNLPPDDERVVRCAVSVHAQVMAFGPSPIVDRLPASVRDGLALDRVVGHIQAFSLAGISAVCL